MIDAGTGFVDVLPRVNPAAFNTALSGQLRAQSGGISKIVGGAISGPVGVGILAAGAAGAAITSLALDFDQAFTRISALSNASETDIASWKSQVLSLSGETAQAPAELADALFFLSSAGLDAAQVMPALEASAKAAATGLGSTADVANIVASAMNAYAESGLTAAEVTDTLVAAVREGRAEPEEFATALGRILPIASTVGVTFDDVTASLAALSNIGLDVNEGVTAMRGVLQAIAAPGTQAAQALKSLGLSAQDLLDAIQADGLNGALQLLDERAQAQTDTQADYFGVLRKVIPNVRSLTGVLGLSAQEAEKVDAIFQNVSDSTGDMGEAFQTTAESQSFQFRQELNKLKVAATELGAKGLPLVTGAVQILGVAAGGAFDFFEALTSFDPGQLAPGFSSIREELLRMFPGILDVNMSFDEMKTKLDELADEANAQAFEGLATNLVEAADGIVGQVVPAVDDLRVHIDDTGQAVANFAHLSKEELTSFEESAVDSLNFVEARFDDLAGRAKISAEQILRSLRDALRDQEQFARNAQGFLSGVTEELGPGMERAAQEMVAALAQAGPEGAARIAALNEAVREGNIKLVRDILATWQRGGEGAEGYVRKLTDVDGAQKNTRGEIELTRGEIHGLAGDIAALPSQKTIRIDVSIHAIASGVTDLANQVADIIADGFRLDGSE